MAGFSVHVSRSTQFELGLVLPRFFEAWNRSHCGRLEYFVYTPTMSASLYMWKSDPTCSSIPHHLSSFDIYLPSFLFYLLWIYAELIAFEARKANLKK